MYAPGSAAKSLSTVVLSETTWAHMRFTEAPRGEKIVAHCPVYTQPSYGCPTFIDIIGYSTEL